MPNVGSVVSDGESFIALKGFIATPIPPCTSTHTLYTWHLWGTSLSSLL